MVNTLLWGLAVLFYGIGDAVFTFLGVQYENIEEASPVTRRLLGANPTIYGLLTLKIVSLVFLYSGYVLIEGNQYRDIVPVGLAVVGLYAVVNNGRAIIIENRVEG